MSEKTKIEWCDYSASPWEGCAKCSPGCLNCYAEKRDRRHLHESVDHWENGAPRRIVLGYENKIRAWNRKASGASRRPTVFASVMDPFDAEVPIAQFANFVRIIHENQNLIFLLLTKRPENWGQRIAEARNHLTVGGCANTALMLHSWLPRTVARTGQCLEPAPPPNVWVGTSVENQEWADKRIPHLLKIPAVGRFLSVEPMLGPVDLQAACTKACPNKDCIHDEGTGHRIVRQSDEGGIWLECICSRLNGIHWVIYGGESGPGARPCNVDWIRDGLRQCKAAGVAPFVKQLGAHPLFNRTLNTGEVAQYGCREHWGIIHPKGGDPTEWPDDLRVREFPVCIN